MLLGQWQRSRHHQLHATITHLQRAAQTVNDLQERNVQDLQDVDMCSIAH